MTGNSDVIHTDRKSWVQSQESHRPCRTIRSVLTSAPTPDQVHACQMMTEVATVSIVAKNKYSGKAGGLPHPARGGTNVRKPFTRVTRPPAIIFASRFALNGSSRHATIMAMGISVKIS